MATRSEVYAAIDTERDYQDSKWGAHGSGHEIPAWLTYMRSYLDEATDQVSRNYGDGGSLETLRKVVALGVCCLEEHGAPPRRTLESIMAGSTFEGNPAR